MQTLTQPTLLLKPFAESGDKNTLPDVNTDLSNPQNADLTNGFPQITSMSPSDGGLPPQRKDFNGLGYLTTTYDFFYQAGGTFTYSPTIATAIGGYPLGARLWYTDSNGISCIVRSAVQNNTNNFLTDPTVIGDVGENKPWVIENFRGIRSQWSLFDNKWVDYELNDQSWLRSDTFSWQDGTVYTEAYNHLVDDYTNGTSTTETVGSYTITYVLASDGHKITTDETNVSNIYSESGVAWYYILDTTNQRFKLPRTKYGLVGLRDTVGKYVPESLPNISGSIFGLNGYNISSSGALNYETTANGPTGQTGGMIGNTTIDAFRSSSTYQDNAPVQQRATQMYLYFYVGQFTQTATEQTAGLNSSLFNGKVDLDLENMNPSSTAKATMVGWGMPDYNSAIGISFPDNTHEYTAPSNGYLMMNFYRNEDELVYGYINGVTSPFAYNDMLNGQLNMQYSIPLAKGDKFYWNSSMSGVVVNTCYFVPCIGG